MKSRCGFYSKFGYCEGVVEDLGGEVGGLGGKSFPPPVEETLQVILLFPDLLLWSITFINAFFNLFCPAGSLSLVVHAVYSTPGQGQVSRVAHSSCGACGVAHWSPL